jgi:glutamine amidotransferase
MIAIINYGSGNVQAIANIYSRLNIQYTISNNITELQQADKLILPGVGAFDEVMHQLNISGLREGLDDIVLNQKKPVMGICVGMQILGNFSEEGSLAGLGWIPGSIKKINIENLRHKPHTPHMGWNSVKPMKSSKILEGLDEEKGFYFLHSYCFHCNDVEDILTTSTYGENIQSSICKENIYGMQFHPEKSHNNGITIFKNFADL